MALNGQKLNTKLFLLSYPVACRTKLAEQTLSRKSAY